MTAATSRTTAAVVLSVLCLAAACAPVRPPAAVAVLPAESAETGMIVAERPLRPPQSGDVRGTILAMLGDAAVMPPSSQGDSVEFVVRAADGTMLSVVQSNPQHLRPGERVVIERRPEPVLLRTLPVASGH